MPNSIDNELKEAIKDCSEYKYSQSSKVSSLGRTIIYAIIGLVWAISYTPNEGFYLQNNLLAIAFYCALFYLILDLAHYFIDTIAYHSIAHRLERGVGSKNSLVKESNKRMRRIEISSFCFLVCKFFLILVISSLFLLGMLHVVK